MTTHWEKRDKKRSVKSKIKKQSYDSFDDDLYSSKKKKGKKRHRSKDTYYNEYVNEENLE